MGFFGKTAQTDRTFYDAVDAMPVNVMFCDTKTFDITYANRLSIETLGKLEHLLPIKAKDIVGTNIDAFHKTPQHQRNLLADPSNLPHHAKIKLGDEHLDLYVTAVYDAQGNYNNAMLT